jgi:hypothetical protein
LPFPDGATAGFLTGFVVADRVRDASSKAAPLIPTRRSKLEKGICRSSAARIDALRGQLLNDAMSAVTHPQKITLAECVQPMRGLLIYCSDYHCSHRTTLSADGRPDDLRLSDLEPSRLPGLRPAWR